MAENEQLTLIDGRSALAGILVFPHETDPVKISFEAYCHGIDKGSMVSILRHVADLWEIEIAAQGDGVTQ